MPDLAVLWQEVIDASDISSRAWLRRTQPLSMHGSTLMLAVADEMTRERIETKLRGQIETRLSAACGQPTRLAVMIEPDQVLLEETKAPAEPEELAPQPMLPRSRPQELRLNPRYTFESFVAGSSNRFAHAAAAAVAETPGKSYNPLMIYGPSGLGKTHLLHAIGHYVSSYFEQLRVKYVSTEELTNDFINAISSNRTAEFRSSYRDVDVLLVDDIQFLESKIQTQEEFFHTFNTLHNAQKQIVMTSDRPPKLLEALEPRLRSRFEWGLMTDIQPPDLETRIAILRKKAASQRLTAGSEVLELIASRIPTNIRELEGALTRVAALASLNQQEMTLPLAEGVLNDLMPEDAAPADAQTIMDATARYFGISLDDLTGSSRVGPIASARQIAMYLCRELTDLSLPKIGARFGGRDHSTVLHNVRKIGDKMREDRDLYTQVTELTNQIKQS
ncbi:chromosomal replication initiator protein DnaA [Tessaracoccus lacteus]|uniref:Chromosomal replication initiator protein DnaA n=1 Tax=Tessaracoccus lacteus TaxID=3041766 RepID=A0ABY8Q1E3_9ACTN|nr:chromosomal replication initiator protein DnaA [Tessaracoccus sp. T21]WGT48599.1 chromosomal replication initiator protein DnaA [Tessaracoccus sp. T21]